MRTAASGRNSTDAADEPVAPPRSGGDERRPGAAGADLPGPARIGLPMFGVGGLATGDAGTPRSTLWVPAGDHYLDHNFRS